MPNEPRFIGATRAGWDLSPMAAGRRLRRRKLHGSCRSAEGPGAPLAALGTGGSLAGHSSGLNTKIKRLGAGAARTARHGRGGVNDARQHKRVAGGFGGLELQRARALHL